MTEPELKQESLTCEKPRGSVLSPLSMVFDHCPSALFAFLTARDAARVACALCEPHFLASRRYAIDTALPFHRVMAGRYPSCFVCNVKYDEYDQEYDEGFDFRAWRLPSALLSMVTRLEMEERYDTDPPLDVGRVLQSMPRLRALRCNRRVAPGDLPRSLTELCTTQAVDQPFSQLPHHLTKLQFKWDADVPLEALNDLPTSLTELSLVHDSDRTCDAVDHGTIVLPSSLTHLQIPVGWLAALDSSTLPAVLELTRSAHYWDDSCLAVPRVRSSLLHALRLPPNCSMAIRAADLPNLRELHVQGGYHEPLDDLPPLLTELTMDGADDYARALDHLPASLTVLKMRRPSNRPLDKLPSSLRLLSCGRRFNQPLNHLPASLTELLLENADSFNQPVDDLPPRLQSLSLGYSFSQPLDALPSSLTRLVLLAHDYHRLLTDLPESLAVLILGGRIDQPLDSLPSSLQELDLQRCVRFDQPLDHLPDSLTKLTLSRSFRHPITRLPRHLTELDLSMSASFNHPLPLVEPRPVCEGHDNNHPSNLPLVAPHPCSISEVHDVNHPFNLHVAPQPLPISEARAHDPSVSDLALSPCAARNLKASILRHSEQPYGVTEGKLKEDGLDFSENPHTYPTALRSLMLGQGFDQPLTLPPSLTKLAIDAHGVFEHPLPLTSLPKDLTYLQLPTDYDDPGRYPEYQDKEAIYRQCPNLIGGHWNS